MRSLMRHRNYLVMMASEHIQHMKKALTQMNVQLQHVISDITGLTGLAILDAVVAGARDPSTLATRPGRRRSANRWKATGEPSTSRPGSNACACIEPIVIRSARATRKSRSWLRPSSRGWIPIKAHAGRSQTETAQEEFQHAQRGLPVFWRRPHQARGYGVVPAGPEPRWDSVPVSGAFS